MSFRSNLVRATTASLLVICFAGGGFADTIRLKDGSRIKGKIVSFSSGRFIVAVGEGSRRREMTVTAGEIDSIDFDTPRSAAATMLASDRTVSAPPEDKKVAVVQKPVPEPVIEEDTASAPVRQP